MRRDAEKAVQAALRNSGIDYYALMQQSGLGKHDFMQLVRKHANPMVADQIERTLGSGQARKKIDSPLPELPANYNLALIRQRRPPKVIAAERAAAEARRKDKPAVIAALKETGKTLQGIRRGTPENERKDARQVAKTLGWKLGRVLNTFHRR